MLYNLSNNTKRHHKAPNLDVYLSRQNHRAPNGNAGTVDFSSMIVVFRGHRQHATPCLMCQFLLGDIKCHSLSVCSVCKHIYYRYYKPELFRYVDKYVIEITTYLFCKWF